MSREEIFFDAITGIREDLIEEAQQYVFFRKRNVRQRYAALAACLALVAVLCFGVYRLAEIRMDIGSGGSTCYGNSSPPPSADSGENCPPSSDIPGAVGGQEDVAPSNPKPDEISFTAMVLDVQEDCLLLEPLPGTGIDNTIEQVAVPTGNLTDLPDFQKGDVAGVRCSEISMDTVPVRASGVIVLWLIHPSPQQ